MNPSSSPFMAPALPPARRLDFSEIPIIDLADAVSHDNADGVATALAIACEQVGFFYILNHGVDSAQLHRLRDQGEAFFRLGLEEKMQVRLDATIRGYLPLGYTSYAGEEREGVSHQEGYWMGYERPGFPDPGLDRPNTWPSRPPGLRRAFEDCLAALEPLVHILQQGFSRALGLAPDHLEKSFGCGTSRLKINHYPPQPGTPTESSLGVVPHTDSGAFTILWQDHNGGLEICNRSGEWVAAPPVEGAFVVNVGNILQILSNGRFSSTPHRVVNRAGVDRYSIPLFVSPDPEARIRPLVGESDNYMPFRYGDYQVDIWRRNFPVAEIPGQGDLDRQVLI